MKAWQEHAGKLLQPARFVLPLGLLWLVALVAGLIGLYQLYADGHAGLDTGSYIPWGLWVALYVFFVETAAGMHLASTLGTVFEWRPFVRILRLNLFLSITFAVGGLTLIFLDLGRPERLWEMYLRPNPTSAMNWMAWIYMLFMIVQVTQLVWEYRADRLEARGLLSDEGHRRVRAVRRTLGYIGFPIAIGLSSGVGFLVGNPASQPFFQVGLYPIHFLATALASGAAVLALVGALFLANRDGELRRMTILAGQLTLVGILAEFLFLFFDYFVSLYGGVPRLEDPVEMILTGKYAWSFWILQVLIGMVIPFLILVTPKLSVRPLWIAAAGAMVAFGFVVVRLNAILPSFVAPQFEELETAYIEPGLKYEYFPSATEWLVGLLVGAVVVAIFWLGYRLLPLVREPGEGVFPVTDSGGPMPAPVSGGAGGEQAS